MSAPDLHNLPETDERLSRKIRLRRCIATHESVAMDRLLRFVLAPDGTLTPDLAGKLPGRGAHLRPTRAALRQAIRTKAFARAFKQAVTVPPDFAEHLGRLVEAFLLSRLSMARRAGHLALGQDAVFAAAGSGALTLLVLPRDMGDNARAKLVGICRDFPTLEFASAETLGAALGRPRVMNLALTNPHKGEQFLALADKFRDFLPEKSQERQPEQ